ncbi:MAG: hypothetical protein QJR13_05370 [Bacillota bacterium]|nr:hypothetical protein [Bacillota bacterium]
MSPEDGFHLSPARALELLRPLPTAAQALHGDLDRFASRMRTLPELAP